MIEVCILSLIITLAISTFAQITFSLLRNNLSQFLSCFNKALVTSILLTLSFKQIDIIDSKQLITIDYATLNIFFLHAVIAIPSLFELTSHFSNDDDHIEFRTSSLKSSLASFEFENSDSIKKNVETYFRKVTSSSASSSKTSKLVA